MRVVTLTSPKTTPPRRLRSLPTLCLLFFASCGCRGESSDPSSPTTATAPRPQAATSTTTLKTGAVPSKDKAEAQTSPPRKEPKLAYVRIRVVSSLERALVEQVGTRLGRQLTQVAKRILVWWIDLPRELRRNDELELVYEPQAEEEPIIHALWFQSKKLKSPRTAVRFRPKDEPFYRFYDPQGREIEQRLRGSPIATYEQITSLLRDGRGHRGIDFKAPIGTPVLAPFSGKVVRKNWATRRNGFCLHLRQPKTGRQALFLHLDRVAKGVRPGVRVRKGQRIAFTGNTGRSSAPHLHYQLQKGQRILDPFKVHKTWRVQLSKADAKQVQSLLARFASLRSRPS